MALLYRLPRSIIEERYTHKAMYAGIIPVYIVWNKSLDYTDGTNEMLMIERNWIPTNTIRVVKWLWGVLNIFNPTNPPLFITGDL